MRQEKVTFTAEGTHKSFWERHLNLLLVTLFLALFVYFDAEFDTGFDVADWTDDLIYGGCSGCMILIGYRLYRYLVPGKSEVVHYHVTDDELLVQIGNKKPIRYPFTAIKQVSVQTHLTKPTVIFGDSMSGLYTGKWEWNVWEVNLYATRKDRLVLLDTTKGLLGISPDAEDEDSFLQELQMRTGLVSVQNDFRPAHAERAGSVWQLVMMVVLANNLMFQIEDPELERVVRVVMVVVAVTVMLSIRMLYPVQKRYPHLFTVLLIALFVLYVALPFYWM